MGPRLRGDDKGEVQSRSTKDRDAFDRGPGLCRDAWGGRVQSFNCFSRITVLNSSQKFNLMSLACTEPGSQPLGV